jgi:hypothetical protein
MHTLKFNVEGSETLQIPPTLPFLNESHRVLVIVFVSKSFPFSFQFFSCIGFVFAEEVADLFLFCLYSVLFEVVELVVSFTFRLK